MLEHAVDTRKLCDNSSILQAREKVVQSDGSRVSIYIGKAELKIGHMLGHVSILGRKKQMPLQEHIDLCISAQGSQSRVFCEGIAVSIPPLNTEYGTPAQPSVE